jgi:hypothetical protein
MKFKCPAITRAEKFSIGQERARFQRVARSMGLEVVSVYFHTLDNFFNRTFTPLDWRLCTHGEPVTHNNP